MFDLRYHVASLAAVFIALVIGILVGVGISGRDVIREGERRSLQARIDELERQTDVQRRRIDQLQAAAEYELATEDAVLDNRLVDKQVAIVFVGSVDGAVRTNVEQMLEDADASMARMRALRVPIDFVEVQDALVDVPDAPSRPEDVGRALAQEFLAGGETPLWDEVGGVLVEEREGGMRTPVDAVVVARNVEAQRGPTARFLAGFYNGLASGGQPAVAVETSGTRDSALPLFDRYGFSTVDNVETPTGRVSLAVLLTGGESGNFGVDGSDGLLPPVEPVLPTG